MLTGLVLSEQILVRGFCDEIYRELSLIGKTLESGNIPHDKIESAVKMWEKKKTVVFVFSNHGNFRELENNIYNLEFYSNSDNIKKSEYCVDVLKHRVKELKESCKFKKENIL